jgi:hypothetical protein
MTYQAVPQPYIFLYFSEYTCFSRYNFFLRADALGQRTPRWTAGPSARRP